MITEDERAIQMTMMYPRGDGPVFPSADIVDEKRACSCPFHRIASATRTEALARCTRSLGTQLVVRQPQGVGVHDAKRNP